MRRRSGVLQVKADVHRRPKTDDAGERLYATHGDGEALQPWTWRVYTTKARPRSHPQAHAAFSESLPCPLSTAAFSQSLGTGNICPWQYVLPAVSAVELARSLDSPHALARHYHCTSPTYLARDTSLPAAHVLPQDARSTGNGQEAVPGTLRPHPRIAMRRPPTDPYAPTDASPLYPTKRRGPTPRVTRAPRRNLPAPTRLLATQRGVCPVSPCAAGAACSSWQPNTMTSTLHDTRRRVLPPAHISAPALDTATTAAGGRSRPRREHIKWGDSYALQARVVASASPLRTQRCLRAPQTPQSTPGQAQTLRSRIPVPIFVCMLQRAAFSQPNPRQCN
ncbi:hypothetical protein C8R45DRAFT_1217108 [Mycena sanguinolenta]|nr:hypothetical protein C8R45DRAFT_1217108 [Mycena sanguinolenta]